MADAKVLDRAFQFIMRRLVETGRAPHYTELAAGLGQPVEAGRQTLRHVIDGFLPGWLYPDTDYIASFAPFNNLPTQYRVSVAGQQKWFALAGLFATPSRRHLLDDNYLSFWYPQRGPERRAVLERIGKAIPYWGIAPS